MIIAILSVAWYLIGVLSFIFWWTKRCDFTTEEIGVCFLCGFLGPLSFFAGGLIHLELRTKTLIKKRDNK